MRSHLCATLLTDMESNGHNSWFGSAGGDGPSLEDFLAIDPSQLPFLREGQGTVTSSYEDCMRYQLFADIWESIDNLHQVPGFASVRSLLCSHTRLVLVACGAAAHLYSSCTRFQNFIVDLL